jgi:hypothetical protein
MGRYENDPGADYGLRAHERDDSIAESTPQMSQHQ